MAGIGDNLGSILLELKWVKRSQLDVALKQISEGASERLGQILLKSQAITEQQLAQALAIQNGLEYVEGAALSSTPEAVEKVSLEFAKQRHALPLDVKDGVLTVAIEDPLDLSLVDDLRFMTNLQVLCKVGGQSELMAAIDRSYEGATRSMEKLISEVAHDVEVVLDTEGAEGDGDEDAPVIKLVHLIITRAVQQRASDIHVEALEKSLRVRYRIDGECVLADSPPKKLQGSFYGRLKMMAGMDIAERRKPQDGAIKIKVLGRLIDLRVSSLPSSFGESIVMRILDKQSVLKGMNQLGFHPTDYASFKDLIARPNGIVLVTGPTGSGKTTTLYAALGEKNKPNVKIITAENPVEYNVSGINQIQVNHEIGLDFARILRAMLRQAPNVILVGEIRDLETATIAIEASLTGHLVFSTLHTNDAPSTITRLIDMGIKPYLVSSSVIAVLAQRLVRVNCEQCREIYNPDPAKMLAAGITPEMAEGKTFVRGAGCQNCNNTGYRGRLGIYELMRLGHELRDAIFHNKPTHVLRELAVKGGMHTLLMDGVRKVFAGLTTVEEVLGVAKSLE